MKILVVEDDATLREALRIELEVLGHQVLEAPTSEAASAVLRYGPRPLSVVTDGHFPRRLGDPPEPLGISLLLIMEDCYETGMLYTGDDALLDDAKGLAIPAVRKPGKISEIVEALK